MGVGGGVHDSERRTGVRLPEQALAGWVQRGRVHLEEGLVAHRAEEPWWRVCPTRDRHETNLGGRALVGQVGHHHARATLPFGGGEQPVAAHGHVRDRRLNQHPAGARGHWRVR